MSVTTVKVALLGVLFGFSISMIGFGDFGQLNSPATVIKSPASSQNSPASGGWG